MLIQRKKETSYVARFVNNLRQYAWISLNIEILLTNRHIMLLNGGEFTFIDGDQRLLTEGTLDFAFR